MTKRLLAHAKMCQQVARACQDENLTADFNRLALECLAAAAACEQRADLPNGAMLPMI